MGRRKQHKIQIREDRLSKLDETKLSVAIWLLAKARVEDRTQRSQPAPPVNDGVDIPPRSDADKDERLDTGNAQEAV
jgi:hypothetical protein